MKEALAVVPHVGSTLQQLRTVSRVSGDAALKSSANLVLAAKSRIVYVKLKKGEVSDHTVVSDCEKYNVVRTEAMQLVDTLQLLPPHKFYESFADLRATVTANKTKWKLCPSRPADNDDEDDDTLEDLAQQEEDEEEKPKVAQLQVTPDEGDSISNKAGTSDATQSILQPLGVVLPGESIAGFIARS
ncbi:hypothetical protein V7S43_009214 [Phytophthora oleae]|uniref:Uncharacterized protein n=1 Tax=Phytophthora oleae TaxID=2107226 RepID=A0ABD3FJN4_9STRA